MPLLLYFFDGKMALSGIEVELTPDSVVKKYLTTAADGKQYNMKHYNLDVILAVRETSLGENGQLRYI